MIDRRRPDRDSNTASRISRPNEKVCRPLGNVVVFKLLRQLTLGQFGKLSSGSRVHAPSAGNPSTNDERLTAWLSTWKLKLDAMRNINQAGPSHLRLYHS